MDLRFIGPIYLGWTLGASYAANIFGAAVSSYMIRYRTAVILAGIFLVIGALTNGQAGIKTLSGLTEQTGNTAFIISLAAALTVNLMIILRLPVSTSQAVVGPIIGIGIMNKQLQLQGLTKIFICWFTTPIGAGIIAIIFYWSMTKVLKKVNIHFLLYDKIMRNLLILAGIYGAYTLGGNNVANVTGVFYKSKIFNMKQALLIGGISTGLGALFNGKKMMSAVGGEIIKIDAFSAFSAIMSHSIAIHIYNKIGVPVSSSQAIVGALTGIGVLRGINTISLEKVAKIFAGWFFTPAIGMCFCLILYKIFLG